ncbi:MAG: hypothetical protein MI922_29860, partial [Bacteroidales bacterium]|nr:hypothetical protein [Bacteroidales bacterium]
NLFFEYVCYMKCFTISSNGFVCSFLKRFTFDEKHSNFLPWALPRAELFKAFSLYGVSNLKG